MQRKTPEWRKEVVEAHRYVPGGAKPCFQCGELFTPRAMLNGKLTLVFDNTQKKKDGYSDTLFCRKGCEDDYVGMALRRREE